ncbi:MAG: valine--tRNA ligase [Simkaniaceae bacterium]|nr:valine--tRNA ligase [Candidatus Sacchlamyda saccharinae]
MPAYEPKEIEEKWYPFWEENGFFKADATSSKPSYCISIPPPNVTGVLHMGHALVDTLQDVLIRWKRMQGFEALWVPGTDHAGIATQTVVERDQMAKTGKRRKDFSREEFLKLVWEWKEKSQGHILSQLRRLGCSCDWDRLAFTMDETRCAAVSTMFKKMYDDGLIYRGDYLVNWDPVTQTALADDEVEYEDKDSHLWYMRYPLSDGSTHLVVATTRPETMLGDTAVAVNPKDERYAPLIGKTIRLPITEREIPIIADPFVDPEFGTGAVKITPAHDPNDYEMGLRHSLPMINMMTPDGKVNELGKEFAGLSMEEARLAIADKIKELGLMEKIEPHHHRVGVSYRSKAVIEPYLSKQWFVKMTAFKDKLISAVRDQKVKIIPKDWESTYFHWIENLRDWCISRQLWWGHRIPIYYKGDEVLCQTDGTPPEGWVQDEDVLDTWFSSGLWPFSVLGWPEETPDLAKFYPNSVLITGHDILFFWVARMILMGEYALDEPPFPETFIHGLIYGKSYWRYNKDGSIAYLSSEEKLKYDLGEKTPPDVQSKWEKMSKSKGNVIDPIEIIDTYGTDAMRIALCSVATHARQIDLDRRRFEEYKNFINKLWNGSAFIFMHLENFDPKDGIDKEHLTLEDKWILSRLNRVIESINGHLTDYSYDKAAADIYRFFWDELCAYYLELVKPILFGKAGTKEQKHNKQCILLVSLCNLLRLFHPMIPFVTEELFTQLKAKITPSTTNDPYLTETLQALQAPACIVAPYPTVIAKEDINPKIEETFAFIDTVLHTIRNIRAEMGLAPGAPCDLIIQADPSDPHLALVQEHEGMLFALTRLSKISYNGETPEGFSASNILKGLTLIIPLPEEMREKELVRLKKQQDKLIIQERQSRGKLGNENFVQKAPKDVVDKLRTQLSDIETQLADISKKLNLFKK